MTNIVLFRLSDDGSMWLADLDAGTVERTEAVDAAENDGGAPRVNGVDFAMAAASRSGVASHHLYPSNETRLKGIDLAHAAKKRADAAAHHLYPSHAPQVDGVDFAHAAKARSDAASHHLFPSR